MIHSNSQLYCEFIVYLLREGILSRRWHYPRKKLAQQIAIRLQDELFSRMAFLGSRRIGKTAFLINDLSPRLVSENCIPVYISLWMNNTAPQVAFIEKLSTMISTIRKESSISELLKTDATKLTIGNKLIGTAEFDLKNIEATSDDIQVIHRLIEELVVLSKGKKVVLLIDEIQHLLTDKSFEPLHYGLRTIFDIQGDKISIFYTGSSRSGMNAMFTNRELPFYHNTQPKEFPLIDDGFVLYCVAKLKTYGINCAESDLNEFWISVNRSPYWVNALMRHVVEEMIPLTEGIKHIKAVIFDSNEYSQIISRMNNLEKKILLRISEKQSLYSESAFAELCSSGELVDRNKVQSAVKRLITKKVVTKLPSNTYLIEFEGIVDAVRDSLQ